MTIRGRPNSVPRSVTEDQLSKQLTKTLPINRIISVFLIAGGGDEASYSSEKYEPALNQTFPVGNTTKIRFGATFCNNLLCGGRGGSSDRSCEKFGGNSFEPLSVSLLEQREFHLCWGLKSGAVILLGGDKSPTTSELVSADGTSSSISFNLTTETS